MAGFLPFHDSNLMEMHRKISKGELRLPQWFAPEVRRLLIRVLDPNPSTRITTAKLVENPRLKKGYKPAEATPLQDSLGDIRRAFPESLDDKGSSHSKEEESSPTMKPTNYNAFDIISLSQGVNLSRLFEKNGDKSESRFITQKPASPIVSKLE